MMTALKAEFRKLLSIRSTYIIVIASLLLVVLFAGYVFGFQLKGADLRNPLLVGSNITSAIMAVSILAAIVASLHLSHEYRYNYILYSLTANRSRSVFLLAKIVSITVFALVFTLLICVASPLLTLLGVHLAGHSLVTQSIPYGSIIWRCLLFGWGYAMLGLLITAIIRNQIGSIVTLLITPVVVENLLSLILKKNSVYLPFSSLNAIIGTIPTKLSYLQAARVFIVYVVAGWLVAWILFLRRDAN